MAAQIIKISNNLVKAARELGEAVTNTAVDETATRTRVYTASYLRYLEENKSAEEAVVEQVRQVLLNAGISPMLAGDAAETLLAVPQDTVSETVSSATQASALEALVGVIVDEFKNELEAATMPAVEVVEQVAPATVAVDSTLFETAIGNATVVKYNPIWGGENAAFGGAARGKNAIKVQAGTLATFTDRKCRRVLVIGTKTGPIIVYERTAGGILAVDVPAKVEEETGVYGRLCDGQLELLLQTYGPLPEAPAEEIKPAEDHSEWYEQLARE